MELNGSIILRIFVCLYKKTAKFSLHRFINNSIILANRYKVLRGKFYFEENLIYFIYAKPLIENNSRINIQIFFLIQFD